MSRVQKYILRYGIEMCGSVEMALDHGFRYGLSGLDHFVSIAAGSGGDIEHSIIRWFREFG